MAGVFLTAGSPERTMGVPRKPDADGEPADAAGCTASLRITDVQLGDLDRLAGSRRVVSG
jgi:hypothetical protein